jgi:dienelactone hydrolase
MLKTNVTLPADQVDLQGELIVPEAAKGIVLFAHGSGSSRYSPRNRFVAEILQNAGLGTLLFDLLTPEEEAVDRYSRNLRFDITLLARRLTAAATWTGLYGETKNLRLGFFGASTGAAAALVAAAELGDRVGAVVSRGGRPDLAGEVLRNVSAPTLLIVGALDDVVIQLNRGAYSKLRCQKEIRIIPGATHLFEEPGTLEAVASLSADWFKKYLNGSLENERPKKEVAYEI